MLKRLFTISIMLGLALFSKAQLVGGNTYSINGTSAPPNQFVNMTEAISYMKTNGISGNGQIILELGSSYTGEPGPVIIDSLNTSATLGVTFRPATGATVVTSIAAPSTTLTYAIMIRSSFIILDGRPGGTGTNRRWTIVSTNSTNGRTSISVNNSNQNIEGVILRYLVTEAEATNTNDAIIYFSGTTNNLFINNIVENNLVRSTSSGNRGIGITLTSGNAGSVNNIIRNNIVNDVFSRGINIISTFPEVKISNNQIFHTKDITQATAGDYAGIHLGSTALENARIHDNLIYNVRILNSTTTIRGINVSSAPSDINNPMLIYNNRIRMGAEMPANVILYGIHDGSTTSSTIYANNSIHINGTAPANKISAAIAKTSSGNSKFLNNIFSNVRTSGTNNNYSFYSTSATITFNEIGYNNYYFNGAGTVLGGFGTGITATTLTQWNALVNVDKNSVSVNPNFTNINASLPDFTINTSIATPLEKGGIGLSFITEDFEGDARNADFPDIGADEFAGTIIDNFGPIISYTPWGKGTFNLNRTLNTIIKDPSGIATGSNEATLRYKKGQAGTWVVNNTPSKNGSNYSFLLEVSNLGTLNIGDTVFYYVAAQDNNSTANLTTNPNGGSGINPPGTTAPSNLNFYIISPSYSGTITVGTNGDFPDLTSNTGLFNALNNGVVTGDINVQIISDLAEPGTVGLNALDRQGSPNWSIKIGPNSATTRKITGNIANALIILNGVRNVSIDGSFNGSGRWLEFYNYNTGTTQAVINLRSPGTNQGCVNVTIKNLVVQAGINTGASSHGIVVSGTSVTGTGASFDTINIINNEVRKAYYGIRVIGSSAGESFNFKIDSNYIGSQIDTLRIGNTGITATYLVNSQIKNNRVFGINSSVAADITGIELFTACSQSSIENNRVYDINQTNSVGYASEGIRVASGNSNRIFNNLVYDIKGYGDNETVGSNISGISLEGGDFHEVYYNTVNMYGSSTTATAAIVNAIWIGSTAVNGLKIKNNIFNNKFDNSAQTGQKYYAFHGIANTDFPSFDLNNNAYLVSPSSNKHFVGRVGTVEYISLNDFKVITQAINQFNDTASQPSGANELAPFINDTTFTLPNNTLTFLESGAVLVNFTGNGDLDFNGNARPAGSGTLPDIGAFEFNGLRGDFSAPTIDSVKIDIAADQCDPTQREIKAYAKEIGLGMDSAFINVSYNGTLSLVIPMTRTSGDAFTAEFTGTIPAGPRNVQTTFNVQVRDSAGNVSGGFAGSPYLDGKLVVNAGPDQTINVNTGTTLIASNNIGNAILITEVTQFRTGTGATSPYPSYMSTTDDDYIEISNLGSNIVSLGGYRIYRYGATNLNYTIPQGVSLDPGEVMILTFRAGTDDPANNVYGMGWAVTTSTVANGYVLRNRQNVIVDAVALNGYAFQTSSGVTSADWSGNIGTSSAGVSRIAADNNTASDWRVADNNNRQTIGTLNPGLPTIPSPDITWLPNNVINDTLQTGVLTTTSVFIASITDGVCTAYDSVTVFVVNPTTPIAGFTVSTSNAPSTEIISLTDTSLNIPNNWRWEISPNNVRFVNGTNANSKNPQVRFQAAGVYDIKLVASNAAGEDSVTYNDVIEIFLEYCLPTVGSSASDFIDDVELNTLNNSGNGSSNTTIADWTLIDPSLRTTLYSGGNYNLRVKPTGRTSTVAAWIDFNQNGEFESSEKLGEDFGVAPNSNTLLNFNVPANAKFGETRMRVRMVFNASNLDPCVDYAFGEGEDYFIDICDLPVNSILADNEAVCIGSNVNVSAINIAGASYIWSNGDQTANTTINAPGMYYVDITKGTCAVKDSILVVYKDPINISLSQGPVFEGVFNAGTPANPDEICAESNLSYQFNPPFGLNNADFGNTWFAIVESFTNNQGNTPASVINFMAPGTSDGMIAFSANSADAGSVLTYNIKIRNLITGCDSVITRSFRVNENAVLDLGQDEAICNGESFVIDPGNITGTILWSDGSNNPTLNVTNAGTYFATLTSPSGCIASDTFVLTVNALPIVNLGADQAICVGSSTTIDAGNFVSYDWNDGSTNRIIDVDQAGNYSVTVTDLNGCENTDDINISFLAQPNSNFTINVPSTATIQLVPAATSGVSYFWNFDNGFLSTQQSPVFTYNSNNAYDIVLIVTDSLTGCSDTTAQVFNLTNVSKDQIANKFGLKVYPNPFQSSASVIFSLNTSANVKLEVVDVLGKTVKVIADESMDAGEKSFDYSPANTASGIYFFRLTVDGQVYNLKAVQRN